MAGITVKTLHKLINEQIKAGNGDKTVLISCDDEGNGFHTLYYGFTSTQESVDQFAEYGLFHDGNDPKSVVLLG